MIAIAPCRTLPDYVESVRRAGGEPRCSTTRPTRSSSVADLVRRLLLPGGIDVDPARYGEAPHATVPSVDAARDEYEIALVAAALAADVPMLAICRGMQVLNVASGGTLVQDIPSQVGDRRDARGDEPEERHRPRGLGHARAAACGR